MPKIGKIGFSIPTAQTDFRFLTYTPKNVHFKNKNTVFFNAYKVKKNSYFFLLIHKYLTYKL